MTTPGHRSTTIPPAPDRRREDRRARHRALDVALGVVERGGTLQEAVRCAAEALAADPWDVVVGAGLLARAAWEVAPEDTALAWDGDTRTVPAGMLRPVMDRSALRRRGAFDTPATLARGVADVALRSVQGTVQVGLDPMCGTGALLVALRERGVPVLRGIEVDALAAVVARVASGAEVVVGDLLQGTEPADLVVANPPFVAPERQDPGLRRRLGARFPWLSGRYDLAVPLAWLASQAVRPGGGVGLVLPASLLVEKYAEPLRRRWLACDRLTTVGPPERFAGVASRVSLLGLCRGGGPAPVGEAGLDPEEVLALPGVPLDAEARPGDAALVAGVRGRSRTVGSYCVVDTGVVAHGSHGGKEAVLHDAPGPGRVLHAEASGFFEGRFRWLQYDTATLHRPKSPALFEPTKVVVQRLLGEGAVRAAVDRQGVYVGHTCTVIVPQGEGPDADRLVALLTDPLLAGLLRIERGPRLDLYPRDVAAVPVPEAWWHDPDVPLAEAWGLGPEGIERLSVRSGSRVR